MSRMSINELRNGVAAKFQSFQIDLDEDEHGPAQSLILRHLLRLPKADRNEFDRIQSEKVKREQAIEAYESAVAERNKAVAERARIEALRAELVEAEVDPAAMPALPEIPAEVEDIGEVDYFAENVAYFDELFTLLAEDEAVARRFLNDVGEDVATLAFVFAEWSKAVQPGEAPSSES